MAHYTIINVSNVSGLFVSIRVRLGMKGGGCKKLLKNINENVLPNEEFFLDLMEIIGFDFQVLTVGEGLVFVRENF